MTSAPLNHPIAEALRPIRDHLYTARRAASDFYNLSHVDDSEPVQAAYKAFQHLDDAISSLAALIEQRAVTNDALYKYAYGQGFDAGLAYAGATSDPLEADRKDPAWAQAEQALTDTLLTLQAAQNGGRAAEDDAPQESQQQSPISLPDDGYLVWWEVPGGKAFRAFQTAQGAWEFIDKMCDEQGYVYAGELPGYVLDKAAPPQPDEPPQAEDDDFADGGDYEDYEDDWEDDEDDWEDDDWDNEPPWDDSGSEPGGIEGFPPFTAQLPTPPQPDDSDAEGGHDDIPW